MLLELRAENYAVIDRASAQFGPGLNLLTDPVWSERASPLVFAGPKRVTAPGVRIEDLPHIDAILLSHNHYDHLDVATLKALNERHAPLIVTPLGNDAIVLRHVPSARIAVGDWGDRFAVRPGAEVHLVPATHWSSRNLRDRRMALWCGFMVRAGGMLIYFAGDTGYSKDFADSHTRFPEVDLALLPIGAYEPRWFMQKQHVNPTEAVRIHRDLKAKHSIAIHWGTFELTDEALDEPPKVLAQALQQAGVPAQEFAVLRHGQTVKF